MLFKIVADIDTRQYANAEQPKIFGQSTTDFFGMQYIPREREMAQTAYREDTEDVILVASGLLPRLIAQLKQNLLHPIGSGKLMSFKFNGETG